MSVRSMVRSNCPPVVGVMVIVISSGSRTAVAATQPHPDCADNEDKAEDEAVVGNGEAELALIEP